jgi:SAM-dependent methyltransferase
MMGSYEDYLLWRVIYPSTLPAEGGRRALEIGSAPGKHLLRLRGEMGYEVWGLEYSPSGAARNREVFAAGGLDPAHVIEADLFDDSFIEEHAGSFDVVISRGFIEHFSDPSEAVERHIALLRTGGTLAVSIPNMRWANYLQALLLNRRLVRIHNREIMRLESFRALFPPERLEKVFCGYYGTLKLNLFLHDTNRFTRLARRAAELAQSGLNLAFRAILRDRGMETPFLSPNLLFIGRKID